MFLAGFLLALIPARLDAPVRPSLDRVLDAIQCVETGGERDGGERAIGDQGRSIGPFQIQRAYWIDAGVPGRYEDCRDAAYARTVVIAYWKRWCPDALERTDAEVLARTHNGGPRGMRKASTLAYWKKVESKLQTATLARGL